MSVTYYGIRYKPTGAFMPQGNRKNRGYTGDSPSQLDVSPPRLFSKQGAARCALTWYLKGVTEVVQEAYSSLEVMSPEYDEVWNTFKPSDDDVRKPEDYEVVPVRIVVDV